MFVTLVLLMSIQSEANVEVTCWFNDCLKSGARVYDSEVRKRYDIKCVDNSCENSGWEVRSSRFGEADFSVQCVDGNCLKNGYRKQNASGEVLEIVKCRERGCLTDGWFTYLYTGEERETRCRESDCAVWGWETFDLNGKPLNYTHCKFNKCFRYGWTKFPSNL